MNKGKINREIEKGITLVSLVITIMILLILSLVVVFFVFGKGSLIENAKNAVEKMKISNYQETIEIIRAELEIERYKDGLSSKEFMDRFEEKLKENDTFKNSVITREEELIIKIKTEEGYIFEVTEQDTKYLGQREEVPDLIEGKNVIFTYSPSEWTKNEVKVDITVKEQGYIVQYSEDGNSWNEYTEQTELVTNKNNKVYHVRLLDEITGQVGGIATANVSNIDTIAPKDFNISASNIKTDEFTISGDTTDGEATEISGISGVEKYYFSIDGRKNLVSK